MTSQPQGRPAREVGRDQRDPGAVDLFEVARQEAGALGRRR